MTSAIETLRGGRGGERGVLPHSESDRRVSFRT